MGRSSPPEPKGGLSPLSISPVGHRPTRFRGFCLRAGCLLFGRDGAIGRSLSSARRGRCLLTEAQGGGSGLLLPFFVGSCCLLRRGRHPLLLLASGSFALSR